jgi:hypothetical protein
MKKSFGGDSQRRPSGLHQRRRAALKGLRYGDFFAPLQA